MRCSSCEPLLDRYIEGTLKPRQMIDIGAHVRECATCQGLLDEVKMIDGLLATTRIPELAQNFTFAVMAEVNSMPAPRARQHPVWSFLALYSAAAWVAVVLAMAFTHTAPRAAIAAIGFQLGRAGAAFGALGSGVSQGAAHTVPALAAFGAGVLLIDIALAAAVALLYFVVRPRLAARLASTSEVSS